MKILMVCLGNICRSPMAQGILEQKILSRGLDWQVDSAGTSGWHDGENPDKRAILVAKQNGVKIDHQISRKVLTFDLHNYDYILAMDTSNYNDLINMTNDSGIKNKIHMVLNFLYPGKNMIVPDPYYDNKFDEVFALLDKAMDKFIDAVLSSTQYQSSASSKTR